jgi:hypothetical protein
VVAHFLPKKKKQGLDEFVEQALASVRKKKKKKKKKAAEPEAEEPEAEEPEAAEAAEPDQPAAPRG